MSVEGAKGTLGGKSWPPPGSHALLLASSQSHMVSSHCVVGNRHPRWPAAQGPSLWAASLRIPECGFPMDHPYKVFTQQALLGRTSSKMPLDTPDGCLGSVWWAQHRPPPSVGFPRDPRECLSTARQSASLLSSWSRPHPLQQGSDIGLGSGISSPFLSSLYKAFVYFIEFFLFS